MFRPLEAEAKKEQTRTNSVKRTEFNLHLEKKKTSPQSDELQHPRSRAFVRAIKDLDVLTDNAVEVKKRLVQIVQSKQALMKTETAEVQTSAAEPVPEIGTDEFERQKKALLDSIRSTISNTVQFMPDELVGILAGCGLEGCFIHLIDEEGNILRHYKCGEILPERLETGYREMQKHDQVSHVEVYRHNICIIDHWGQSKTIRL